MALRKRNRSIVINRAETRVAAISSIADPLDFGGGVTLDAYRGKLAEARQRLSEYNALLAQADTALQAFLTAETMLAEWSDRMLSNIGGRYGKYSPEYLQAGGTPKVLRRRLAGTETTTEPEAEATAA